MHELLLLLLLLSFPESFRVNLEVSWAVRLCILLFKQYKLRSLSEYVYAGLKAGHVRGPMQNLGAGPLWAVFYDVIVLTNRAMTFLRNWPRWYKRHIANVSITPVIIANLAYMNIKNTANYWNWSACRCYMICRHKVFFSFGGVWA